MSGSRIARRALLVLLLLLLALPLGLLGLLASEAGTGWLLARVAGAAQAQGIELRFERSQGNLLRRLELTRLHLLVADTQLDVERLVVQWRPRALLERRLHVELLELSGLQLRPPPAAATEPAPLQLPDLRLPLAVQLDRLQLDGVRVEQPTGPVALDSLVLAATLDADGLHVAGLQLAADGARLDGELSVQTVAPHALQGRLSALIEQRLTGDDIGPVELVANLAGNALQPSFEVAVAAPTRARLRGRLALDQVQPGFELDAEWPALNWPLQGVPQVGTTDGRLSLRGTADDYRLEMRAGLQLPDLPAADVELAAQGDQQGLLLKPLTLRVQDGRVQADGSLRWAEGVRWQLELLAERLDPGLFAAEWPGQIAGRLGIDGSYEATPGAGLAVNARIQDVAGTLRGYPVSASGALEWHAGRLKADRLRLASGPNRVNLDGQAAERLDLGFDIEAPDLSALYPGLAGRLQGSGRVQGTPAAPALVARLDGSGLVYQGTRVQAVTLDVDWRDQGGSGRLQLSDVEAGATRLASVAAELDGTPAAHRLSLAAEGPDGRVDLAAEGGVDERQQVWVGTLQQMTLSAAAVGEWGLRAPAALSVGAKAASTGRLCLGQRESELCVSGGWDSASGLDLGGTLRGLELAGLAAQLPGEAVIEGRLAADFAAKGPPARPEVTFELRPGDGHIRLEDAAQPFDLAYSNARITGQFADDRGSAELRFELGPNGRASGSVSVGAERAGQRTLGGTIQADFPDLGLVTGFVPALDEVQGRLHVEATLGGTLAGPQLTGVLRVADARARVPAAGIQLTGIDIAVQGQGDAPLRLSGQITSGEGQIKLDGRVDLAAAGGPVVDLTIRGKDFEAAKLPEALVLVSPDLRLQGKGPYHLSGKLRVPRAAIELKELPASTVAVSEDEILVGAEPAAPRAPAARNLTAKVRLELGDAVTFKGFGLSTGLTGSLDAAADERGTTTVDGKIELRDGRYQAYGQDLTVERGRLLFAGPPGNPDVDLRALRESRDGQVKAYLAVSGPLSKPRPRVYSEPALPEAEALAYLLTGRGLDQANQQEGSNIASAALSLGMSKGEPLLQKLSDRVGLDDLRVESGANGLQDSSLLLGKYLNPDLYLGYTQGLFKPEGQVLLRLRLSKRLELESRSGTEQSVDLFYRLEHN